MKKVILFSIFLCIGSASCADRAASSASNSRNVMYDLSSSKHGTARELNASVETGGVTTHADGTAVTVQNISLAQTQAASIDTGPSDRKIIRNADLDLETENPEEAHRKIISIAELRGGFVVESHQSASEVTATSRDIVTMTVRVPSQKFSEALADIRNTSTRVVIETIKGSDVTEEFIDLTAQVRAKKALEQQFMEIMKRSNTVQEALTVQSQISGVRGEIERIEGRQRFLENQSSLSTIKIRLQTAKVFASSSVGFGDRLTDSFTAGADVALNFVLGFLTFVVAALPFALFIGLPAFGIIRYVLRRQARQNLELTGG